MLRDVLAAVAGVVVALLTIMLMDWISHAAFPVPPGLDVTDTEALSAHMKSAPAAALVIVLLGPVIGAFDGTLLACLIGRARAFYFALTVGVLVLVGTVTNLIMIPHPAWFAVASVAGVVIAAAAAALLGVRIRNARAETS